jgi:hypothetical protein
VHCHRNSRNSEHHEAIDAEFFTESR